MSEKTKVLIVDDEPNNRRALDLDLEDEDYEILTAEDGVQGWEVLQQHKDGIKTILLDRMMPNMDGMQFMEKLKEDDSVSLIPVIMQTAAAGKEQVVEGIQAGVYYYLTKPYEKIVMLSIVRAAIREYADLIALRGEVKKFTSKLSLIRDCSFEIQTLEDGSYLTTFLSNFFPDPERMVYGLSELLINAIEHGNLGITYAEKSALNKEGKWMDEVAHRLSLPAYKDKKVKVSYAKGDHEITLKIKDEGKGFNWEEYLEFSPERAMDSHGRGIAISKMRSFDRIEYLGNGNEVVCTVKIN